MGLRLLRIEIRHSIGLWLFVPLLSLAWSYFSGDMAVESQLKRLWHTFRARMVGGLSGGGSGLRRNLRHADGHP